MPAKSSQVNDWVKVAPSRARAEFKMPIKPRFVERSFTPVIGRDPIKVRLYISTTNGGLATYIVSYHDLQDRPTGKNIDKTLDGAVRGSLEVVNGSLAKQPDKLTYLGKHPGRQFVYGFSQRSRRNPQQEKVFAGISRVYLVKQRQYQMTLIMEEKLFSEALAAKFLNSFRLVKPKSDLPPVPRKTK